jgi:hypothetical protein
MSIWFPPRQWLPRKSFCRRSLSQRAGGDEACTKRNCVVRNQDLIRCRLQQTIHQNLYRATCIVRATGWLQSPLHLGKEYRWPNAECLAQVDEGTDGRIPVPSLQ